jgi:hypothetical protein
MVTPIEILVGLAASLIHYFIPCNILSQETSIHIILQPPAPCSRSFTLAVWLVFAPAGMAGAVASWLKMRRLQLQIEHAFQ